MAHANLVPKKGRHSILELFPNYVLGKKSHSIILLNMVSKIPGIPGQSRFGFRGFNAFEKPGNLTCLPLIY